jgi:hypothetical protein
MQTTLLNGFTGDRNEIQTREKVLRAVFAQNPQCFRQLVKLCNGEDCVLIAARKLRDLGLLDEHTYLDDRGRPNLASANPNDVAIILSAVTISASSGVTFGSPYRTKAGRRSPVRLEASNKATIAAGGSEGAQAASA